MKSVVGDVPVGFRYATAPVPGSFVNVYLYEITSRPTPSTLSRLQRRIFLRYLITAAADDPVEAHSLLENLIFSALDEADFEVELDPVSIAFWKALGAPPQPSFTIKLPAMHEKIPPESGKVLRPPVLHLAPVSELQGVVFDAGGIPRGGCTVELTIRVGDIDKGGQAEPGMAPAATVRFSTETDSRGRFRLLRVPSEWSARSVRVITGSHEEKWDLPRTSTEYGAPLEFRLSKEV